MTVIASDAPEPAVATARSTNGGLSKVVTARPLVGWVCAASLPTWNVSTTETRPRLTRNPTLMPRPSLPFAR